MKSPVSLWKAWRTRRKAAKALQLAERRRQAFANQIAARRERHGEFKPLERDLQRATEDSLRAFVALQMREVA